MMLIGVLILVIAAVLIVFGVAGTAATWLLWLGIALVVVGAVLLVFSRRGTRL